MPILEVTGMQGANRALHDRFLPNEVGVDSLNQRPSRAGLMEPWREPLLRDAVAIPASPQRITIYRLGRETATPDTYWLSWTTAVHVMRGFDTDDTTERTYYTGAGSPKWTDNLIGLATEPYPTAARELAVPQPDIAPTVMMDTDGPSGDPRQPFYVYTWVNDIGWESAPSPPTESPAAKPGAVLDLTAPATVPAGNYGVNRLRWYRTQATASGDADFFFLKEYAIDATGMQDNGEALNTLDDQLPTSAATMRLPLASTASFLTDCWNSFAAAIVGKTVRCCEPELIYAWPLGNEYPITNTPIGLAAFAQRLVVFTLGGAEILTGSDPEALDQKPLDLPVCVAPRGIVVGDTYVMWPAKDHLAYYGIDGYRNLTPSMDPDDWRALNPETMVGSFLDGLYFASYDDGSSLKGLIVDPGNPKGLYFLSQGYHAHYWDRLLRKLYVLDGDELKEWDSGAAFMSASFKSKRFRQIEHTEGEWLEILCDGNATVTVWVDAVQRFSRLVPAGQYRLPDGIGGRDWQLQIDSNSPVQGAVIE